MYHDTKNYVKQYVNNQERNNKFIYTRQVNSGVSSEDVPSPGAEL